MIIDVTGITLTPGNGGKNCLGNGKHKDMFGNTIECCCDECNYYLCCCENHTAEECKNCYDEKCPLNTNKKTGSD